MHNYCYGIIGIIASNFIAKTTITIITTYSNIENGISDSINMESHNYSTSPSGKRKTVDSFG